MRHAETLAEWDRQVLRNRRTLLELEEELRKVGRGQPAGEDKGREGRKGEQA